MEHTFSDLLPLTQEELSHLLGAGHTNTTKYKKGFEGLGCNKDNGLHLSAGVFWLHMNWLSGLDSHRCGREACFLFQCRKIQNYEPKT